MNNIEINKIICDDTIEAMKNLPDESIDMIFADPPYWLRVDGVLNRTDGTIYNGCNDEWDKQFHTSQDYKKFTRNWLSECKRLLKPNGSFWVIGGMQCIYTIGAVMQDLNFWIINDIVWQKTNPTPNFKGTRLNNSHETLIWATKSKNAKYTFNYKTAKELNTDTVSLSDFKTGTRKQLGSVWKIGICQGSERLKDITGKKLHSTQKPEELLYRIICISTKLGDTILDPFGGTMTTGAVAKKTGRNYICIEQNISYCIAGQQRIDSVVPLINAIEKAEYDIKPPRAEMSDMIEKKYFIEGESFFYNNVPCCTLTKTGKVIDTNGHLTDMHSAIARIKNVKASRLNGWDFWQVKRNNTLTDINLIRQQYLKEVKLYGQNTKDTNGIY